MMMVGEAVLSAFFEVLFHRLGSRLFQDFYKRRELSAAILERFNISLMTINAVLSDAEEKQIVDQSVKKWVQELRDAVYHAEDVLDDISTEALRCTVEAESSASSGKFRQLRGKLSLGDLLNRHSEDLESKLEKITLRLERLAKQRTVLGLKETIGMKPVQRLPTTSLLDESEICGRDMEKEEIMRALISEDPKGKEISVVAIVGVGGVGKTALTQLLYNDQVVKEHFTMRAWAYVSEEFDIFKITKAIFESVLSRHCDFTDLDMLQVRLKDRLTGHKFLLVLDDLWNESFVDWDLLRRPFKSAARGSRIIITTRSQRVASVLRAGLTHTLHPLPEEDCWSVFKKHAFEDEEPQLGQAPEFLARMIARKCQGLPLAAKVLGGLLRSQDETREWERILACKMWELPADKSNILTVLRVSYHYLPAHLKQCFTYCSIFPKGYAFEKENLVRLWMAEGFLRDTGSGKTMEELGVEYFYELASRSFFQQKNKSQFLMHDLINDLAQYVAGEFCFKDDNGGLRGISERTRHFSYQRDSYDRPIRFDILQEVKYLRTFLPLSLTDSTQSCCLDRMVGDRLLPPLVCLRVLSLSCYKISALPSELFVNLKHVRYVDLSYTEISNLPKSLCSLYNLQTLVLSYCSKLIELPQDFFNLINLRYLALVGTRLIYMPRKFGRLRNLQTLTTFIVGGSRGAMICELSDLSLLQGKLTILELQNVVDVADARRAELKSKRYLKEIVFKWNASACNTRSLQRESTRSSQRESTQMETDVFEQLRPHENIERITIENYGGRRFPDWLSHPSFSSIVFLRLSDCNNCISLPSLGQLSGLKELHITRLRGLQRIGPEFYSSPYSRNGQGQERFKSLTMLRFEDMPEWTDWLFERPGSQAFPSLQHLFLRRCPRLATNLPSELPSLKLLHIYDCQELDFQPDQGNYSYKALQQLIITNSCDSLISFPLGFFSNLEDITIQNCVSLQSFQVWNEHMSDLSSLRKIKVSDCPNLESFPGRGFPPNVDLSVVNCRNMRSSQSPFLGSPPLVNIPGSPRSDTPRPFRGSPARFN